MKKKILKIFELLKAEDAPKSDFVKYTEKTATPFSVLLSCILSLRTNDKTTMPATLRLFSLGKKPEDFLKVSIEEIEKAIYPVGFYKTKAKQIKIICETLVDKYNAKVPDTIDELLKFKGVGRKTANLVIAKGFNRPAICVDVHVHRIFNRIGLIKTKTPDETEFDLRKIIPKKLWIELNTLFVTHGQNTCKPTNPKCERCIIERYCDFNS